MKKVLVCMLTLVVIAIVNYLFTLLGLGFIEVSFFVGLLMTAIIYFFTSTGGFSSNFVRLEVQSQTGYKMDEEKRTFSPTWAFYTGIAYTVVSIIVTLIYYKDYF